MLDDDKPTTDRQARQIAIGQSMALSAAVHALIASHPSPAAFSANLDVYSDVCGQVLLTMTAIQGDDGLRQSFSETLRGLRAAIPKD